MAFSVGPVALLLSLGLVLINLQAARAGDVSVDVGDFYFCSPSFQGGTCPTSVTAGDTVTWQFVGTAPHTVTECDDTFANCPPTGGGFSSGQLSQGATFSQKFNSPGAFEYWCAIHGAIMQGRVTVVQPTATPSSTPAPTTGPAQTLSATPTPSAGDDTATPSSGAIIVPGGGGPHARQGRQPLSAIAVVASGFFTLAAGFAVLKLSHRPNVD